MTEPSLNATTILKDQPEFARLLGILMAEWALAEEAISSCLQLMLNLEDGMTEAIYQHFTSTRAKIELVIRLNEAWTNYVAPKITVRDLLDKALELNTMRNKYVHAMWAINAKHPNTVGRCPQTLPQAQSKKQKHETEYITIERLTADINAISAWTTKVNHALHHLRLFLKPRK